MKIKSLLLLGLLTTCGMNAWAADHLIEVAGIAYQYDDADPANPATVIGVSTELSNTNAETIEIPATIKDGGGNTRKVIAMAVDWAHAGSYKDVTTLTKTITVNFDNFTTVIPTDCFTPITALTKLVIKGNSSIDAGIVVPAYAVKELDFSGLVPKNGKTMNLESAITNLTTETLIVNDKMGGIKFSGTTSKLVTVKGIKTIVDGAFATCPALKTVELADGAIIGISAFANCANLETINLEVAKTIGKGAFDACAKLKNVVLTNAETIDAIAFRGTAVESLTIPANIKKEGLVSDESEGSFAGMANLTTVTIDNNNLESVGQWFTGDTKLEKVTITSTSIKSLGEKAFYQRGLKEIDLEGATALTTIGTNAFAQNSVWESFTVPATVETIGAGAFGTNDKLATVDFSKATALKEIKTKAFANTPMTTIDLSAAAELATVANDAFPQNAYTSVKLAGTKLDDTNFTNALVWLTSAHASLTEITLPEGITTLGGFNGFAKLASITIPENVTAIADNAFYQCALTSIVIPAKVVTIGQKAFEFNCLESITFSEPGALKTIGINAFAQNKKLTSVAIPSSVEKIYAGAFGSDELLATVDFSKASSLIKIFTQAFAGTPMTTIDLDGATSLNEVENDAFPQNEYTSVKLNGTALAGRTNPEDPASYYDHFSEPFSAPYIMNKAYNQDGSLEITLPKGLETVNAAQFKTWTALKSISLPKAVATIGANAFEGSGLTAIKIRENVATIGESAFQGCAALTLVNLSEATKLEEIGKKVFADCAALESVDFAGATALKTIGESAFNGCGLTGVKVTGTIETIATQAFYNNKLESVDFSEAAALTTIGAKAFGVDVAENSKLTALDLSGATALTSVADNAFPQNEYASVTLAGTKLNAAAVNAAFSKDAILQGSNKSLTEITFPADYDMATFNEFPYFENLTAITLPADATEIPDYAFQGANITSFEVSDKIVRIGKHAFDGSALESIDFTKATALETIDNYAFANTANLESVGLPKNLEVINENVFEASALKSVKIKSHVKKIEACAFRNAAALASVNFEEANALEEIGADAFAGTALTEINLDGATKLNKIAATSFAANKYTSVKLAGTQLAYTDDAGVYHDSFSAEFATILADSKETLAEITLPAGLTAVKANQFNEFTALTQIALPKAVTNIEEKAFFKSGLTAIKIRENVKEIGAKAFAGCKDLATANLADAAALETIGDGAFASSDPDQKDAPVITTVVIPAKVNTIGLTAFYNCEKLANVDFSQAAALTTIGNLAFAGTAITAIDLSGCAELATISGETFPKNKYTKLLLGGTKLDESKIVLIDLENATETLAEATLPAGITYVPQNFFGQFRYGDRFANPVVKKPFSKLTSVSLPKSVAVIQDGAFAGAGLTAFKFRENIEAIEDAAFADCANLATLNFSEATKLEYIGASAFLRAGVTEAIIPENADGNSLTIGSSAFRDSKLKSFSAKSWAGLIAPKTFQNTKLNGIKIPATVTGIGEEAFDGCKKLGTVTFLHAKKAEKIDFIGDYAFRNCESLEALDLSNTKLEKIESNYPFEGCTALATITFPEELISLNSDYLFADCPIENFEAPNLTQSAVLFGYYREFDEEDGSFIGYEQRDKDHANTTLKTVKMGGPIKEGCFAFCTSLESVEWLGVESVPSGSIGMGSAMPSYPNGPVDEGAFAYCTALQTFTYLPEYPITKLMVSDDAFVGCTPYVMFVTNSNYLDWIVANYRGAAPVNATFGDNIDITKVKTVQDKANAKQFVGKYVNNSATPVYIDANEAKAYSIYVDGDAAYFQACRTFNGYYIIEPQMTYTPGGGVDGSGSWSGTPGWGSHVILKTDEAKEIEIHQLTQTDAIKLDLARYMMSYGPGAGLRQSSIAYDDVYDSQKDDDLARVQHYAGVSAGSYLYRLTNTAGQGFGFTAFTGSTIKEGQFFVACEAKPAGAGRLAEVWLDEDGKVISGDVTGIESVEKIDVNNGAIYNLQGVRVDNPVKGGLYIQNGKKIVVK